MAVKKTKIYSSLWASCDALRGGMDASQYKDYVLTLLFMKYVTDKYKGQKYADIKVFDKAHDTNPDPDKRTGCSFDDFIALKNKKNIGEGIDKVIARLAEENVSLKGVIDIAHFNDEAKIGKGQEMVDKLTKLIAIFQSPELDFSKNRAEGDDIIGDAYEYLMRNFATESGKSKGQFYTPAEVSRILAQVIGIDKCTDRDATICDESTIRLIQYNRYCTLGKVAEIRAFVELAVNAAHRKPFILPGKREKQVHTIKTIMQRVHTVKTIARAAIV